MNISSAKPDDNNINNLIAEGRRQGPPGIQRERINQYQEEEQGPSTSDGRRGRVENSPEEQIEDMIRQAEAAKVKIFATPGKEKNSQAEENFNINKIN